MNAVFKRSFGKSEFASSRLISEIPLQEYMDFWLGCFSSESGDSPSAGTAEDDASIQVDGSTGSIALKVREDNMVTTLGMLKLSKLADGQEKDTAVSNLTRSLVGEISHVKSDAAVAIEEAGSKAMKFDVDINELRELAHIRGEEMQLLLSKMALILNEKKKRIRELEKLVAAQTEVGEAEEELAKAPAKKRGRK